MENEACFFLLWGRKTQRRMSRQQEGPCVRTQEEGHHGAWCGGSRWPRASRWSQGCAWGGGASHQLREPPACEPDAALTALFTAPYKEPVPPQQRWGAEVEGVPREQRIHVWMHLSSPSLGRKTRGQPLVPAPGGVNGLWPLSSPWLPPSASLNLKPRPAS